MGVIRWEQTVNHKKGGHSVTGVWKWGSMWPPGGHSTWGYAPCATKKTLLFCARFHRKTPIFTNFHQMTPYFSKISTFLTKCWKIFGHFGPESPYFWCISLKDPIFLCALSLKDPLFWRNLSPKDPYIWGAWWHSYVTFICECPPGCGRTYPSRIFKEFPRYIPLQILETKSDLPSYQPCNMMFNIIHFNSLFRRIHMTYSKQNTNVDDL